MENIRQDLRRTCRCFWNSEQSGEEGGGERSNCNISSQKLAASLCDSMRSMSWGMTAWSHTS